MIWFAIVGGRETEIRWQTWGVKNVGDICEWNLGLKYGGNIWEWPTRIPYNISVPAVGACFTSPNSTNCLPWTKNKNVGKTFLWHFIFIGRKVLYLWTKLGKKFLDIVDIYHAKITQVNVKEYKFTNLCEIYKNVLNY